MKQDIENVKNTLKRYKFPVDIIIEVTNFCNLKCIMCPQKDLKRKKGEMSDGVYRKIIDEVAIESPESRIWLAIMGEPLLIGNRIIDMIQYAKTSGIKSVNLNTNGMLLEKDITQKLVDSGLDYILFGIDAYKPSTYRKIRINGDLESLVKEILYMIEYKHLQKRITPEIIMQFIMMDENEKELDDFIKYWLDKKQTVKVRPKLGWGTGVEADNLKLSDSQRNFPCPWLTRTVSIHWDGKFAQCDADFEGRFSPGNIKDNSIKEIWRGELAKRREKHWELNFDHELCTVCKDWQAGRSKFIYPENI